jgi:hypothetical protein
LHRAEASLDVSQALPPGELGKSKAEELIEAGKAQHFVLATIAHDALAKFVQGE